MIILDLNLSLKQLSTDLLEGRHVPVNGVSDLVEALLLLHLQLAVLVERVLLEEKSDTVAGVQEVSIFGLIVLNI